MTGFLKEQEIDLGDAEFLWHHTFGYAKSEQSDHVEIHFGEQSALSRKSMALMFVVLTAGSSWFMVASRLPLLLAAAPVAVAGIMYSAQLQHKRRRYRDAHLLLRSGMCRIMDGNRAWELLDVKRIHINKWLTYPSGSSSLDGVAEMFVGFAGDGGGLLYFPLMKVLDASGCDLLAGTMAGAIGCPVTQKMMK